MIESADLARADDWHGGFSELAHELGDTDDARLDTALTVFWSAAGVEQETAPCSSRPSSAGSAA